MKCKYLCPKITQLQLIGAPVAECQSFLALCPLIIFSSLCLQAQSISISPFVWPHFRKYKGSGINVGSKSVPKNQSRISMLNLYKKSYYIILFYRLTSYAILLSISMQNCLSRYMCAQTSANTGRPQNKPPHQQLALKEKQHLSGNIC